MNKSESSKETVFVLGGTVKQNPDTTWRTTSFEEKGDNFGVTGDYVRPKAAALLYKKNHNIQFFVSGGRGQNKNIDGAPSVASVMAKELISYGVPSDVIEEEGKSESSLEQLKYCAKIVQERNLEHVSILSNEYHLPRIQVMLERFNELKSLQNAQLLSAESILVNEEPQVWKDTIKKAYDSDAMQKRIELEKQGIDDILKNKYRTERDSE